MSEPNVESEKSGPLICLRGRATNYKCTRQRANFVFTEADQTKMGLAAVAAALVGQGAQAVATASHASDLEEDADFVEFSINGRHVQGWLWRSPFKEGDELDVVVKRSKSSSELVAAARPSDRTIALYPHCASGRLPHYLNAAFWWLVVTGAFTALLTWFMWDVIDRLLAGGYLQWAILGNACFWAAMIFSLTRRWLPFVKTAESVFSALGWPKPWSVNLRKRTKQARHQTDSVEYGAFYFHY